MEEVQDTNTKQVSFSKVGSVVFPPGETSSRGNRRARQKKKMCKRLYSIIKETEAVKKSGEDMQKLLECAGEKRFDKPIEELTLEELYEFEAKMEKIHVRIQGNINKMQAASSLMLLSKDN